MYLSYLIWTAWLSPGDSASISKHTAPLSIVWSNCFTQRHTNTGQGGRRSRWGFYCSIVWMNETPVSPSPCQLLYPLWTQAWRSRWCRRQKERNMIPCKQLCPTLLINASESVHLPMQKPYQSISHCCEKDLKRFQRKKSLFMVSENWLPPLLWGRENIIVLGACG